MNPTNSALFCAVTFLYFAAAASAQDKSAATSRAATILDSMPRAKRIREVAISPDGARVAYTVNQKLVIAPVSGGPSQEIPVKDNLPVRDVAWSPDSKRLAFLADLPGGAPSAELWTAAADGTALTQHGELKGYAQAPRFSPDGSKLA